MEPCLALRAAVLVKALSHGLKAGEAEYVTTGKGDRLREELQADGASQLQTQRSEGDLFRDMCFSFTRTHGGICWKE